MVMEVGAKHIGKWIAITHVSKSKNRMQGNNYDPLNETC